MILSTLLDRKPRYQNTTVERIRIQPTLLAPVTSTDSGYESENGNFADYDCQKIVNDGHIFWLEDDFGPDEGLPTTLPGCVEDENLTETSDFTSKNSFDTSDEPTFNLLPNGKREKLSLRNKIRNACARKFCYRRAAYALDSKTTSFLDRMVLSAEKMRKYRKSFKIWMCQLMMTETSYNNVTSFDNLFWIVILRPFTHTEHKPSDSWRLNSEDNSWSRHLRSETSHQCKGWICLEKWRSPDWAHGKETKLQSEDKHLISHDIILHYKIQNS